MIEVHVCELELRPLELADALAELDALLRIFHSFVNSALAQAQSLRGDADTAAVQRMKRDLEALAFLAEQVLLGDNAVLHEFQMVGEKPEMFIMDDENMKPLAELANIEAGMTISAYGTMPSIQVIPDAALGGVFLNQEMPANILLKGGETFASRVIYGFDPLHERSAFESLAFIRRLGFTTDFLFYHRKSSFALFVMLCMEIAHTIFCTRNQRRDIAC